MQHPNKLRPRVMYIDEGHDEYAHDPMPMPPKPLDIAHEMTLTLEERSARRARHIALGLQYTDDLAAWKARRAQPAEQHHPQLHLAAPPCDVALRLTGTLWCAYENVMLLHGLFNPQHLSTRSARLLRHVSSSARLLYHSLNQQATISLHNGTPRTVGGGPGGRALPPDWTLHSADEPPFQVARRVTAISNLMLELRHTAAGCAQHALDPDLVLAYLLAVQHLARTEFLLNRWLLRHGLPLVCEQPSEQRIVNGELGAFSSDVFAVAEQTTLLRNQTVRNQAFTAVSRNGITDRARSEPAPPITPQTLRTPPHGPRLNSEQRTVNTYMIP